MIALTAGPWIVGPMVDGRRKILGPAAGPFQAKVVAEVLTGQIADDNAIAAVPYTMDLLRASFHALRSYQYGNGATDLAQETADRIESVLKDAGLIEVLR